MKAIIVGTGKMGNLIEDILLNANHHVVERYGSSNINQLENAEAADVLIDFSSPKALPEIISYITKTGAALISGTTGYTAEEMEQLQNLAQFAPVMYSANYSLGIAVFKKVLSEISATLISGGFDIELVEAHHNQKVDAPSGTAKALLTAIDPADTSTKVYGRSGLCGKRNKSEIGVHSIRGGTVAGEHTVMFLGEDEKLEIKHSALSRRIFALGAVRAAERLYAVDNGYYIFEDIMM